MKFKIIDADDTFGKHRFSNNDILRALSDKVEEDDSLLFTWWTEKIFLHPDGLKYKELLKKNNWFGVMHVPLLTPSWAMTGQNNLSQLYFDPDWRESLKKCKGLIFLSEHMAFQFKSIYKDIDVFTAKHPTGDLTKEFSYEEFLEDPKIVLVGAWLRNYDDFLKLNTGFRKIVLFNHYAESYIRKNYSKYSPNIEEDLSNIEVLRFLDDEEYDKLIGSSVVYLGLHETSANNALCECISGSIPFLSKKHPAIVEYCGNDYPLFSEENSSNISLEDVLDASNYLKNHSHLKENLSIDSFLNRIEYIYNEISKKTTCLASKKPNIYIVTPTFNSSETLTETLESVYNQDMSDCTVFHHVQDSLSTDNTKKILISWDEKINRENKGNYHFSYSVDCDDGMYDGIVKGFSYFKKINDNDWMTWINSDDQLAEDALKTISAVAKKFSEVDWVTGFPAVRTEENKKIIIPTYYGTSIVKNGYCDGKNHRTIQQEGTFWKYKSWKNLSISETLLRYRLAGDFSLWCALAKITELYQIEKPMGWFNRRPGQLSVKNRDAYFSEVNRTKNEINAAIFNKRFTSKIICLKDEKIKQKQNPV